MLLWEQVPLCAVLAYSAYACTTALPAACISWLTCTSGTSVAADCLCALQAPDGTPGRAAVLMELRKLRLFAIQVRL